MLYGILLFVFLIALALLFTGCRRIQKKAASDTGSTAALPVSRYRAFSLYLALIVGGLALLNLAAALL